MRVAFVGKGGSGKTTLSALFSRHLARSGAPVVAIDGDINQHLAYALGLGEDEIFTAPPLSARTGEIKDYLRGTNPRIPSVTPWSRPPRPAAGLACCGCWATTRSTPVTCSRSAVCR
jgi:CO dehydrogenase maturation factor